MVAVAVVMIAYLPRGAMFDAEVRFQDLARMMHGQPPESKYSMAGPLVAAPLYFLGESLGDPIRWVWYFNRIVVLSGCLALWRLLAPVLSAGGRMRFLIALMLPSVLPYHLMFFGGEPFTCTMVAVGLTGSVLHRAWWGMPLAVIGTVNTPGTVGALAVASVVLAARTRRLRFLLAAPAAAGLCLLENYLRRGSVFSSGYDADHGVKTVLPYSGLPTFSYPFFFGLLSVLFSFGKGLVFFIPGLFLPRPSDSSRRGDGDLGWLYRVWLGYVVGLVLVYSQWWSWYGGWFWGPRFFLLAAFPAALVLAQRTLAAQRMTIAGNLLTVGVLALSTWVGIVGVVYRDQGLEPFLADMSKEYVVWYVPECSGLWWPFVWHQPLTPIDGSRIAVMVAAFACLAAPVAKALRGQAPGLVASLWQSSRAGGPFRL